jgi:hypothetical protein
MKRSQRTPVVVDRKHRRHPVAAIASGIVAVVLIIGCLIFNRYDDRIVQVDGLIQNHGESSLRAEADGSSVHWLRRRMTDAGMLHHIQTTKRELFGNLFGPKNTKKPKVAVYYYPWYGPDFHNNIGYPRRELIPPQYPSLGEYDDRQPSVIAQHIQWTVNAGVSVWVTSWFGPGRDTDTTTRNNILTHPDIGKINIALFYETEGRIPQNADGTWNLSNVAPDIQHIALNYFGHPQYLRIGRTPVLFIYLSRSLFNRGILADVINIMRTAASQRGYNLYIVGDQVWRNAPANPTTYQPFQLLDGVTNYDVYGNVRTRGDFFARQVGVDNYQNRQIAWLQATKDSGRSCAFLPSVTPGFLKRGDFEPMSRKLDESSPPGSLFRALLMNAFKVTDDRADNMVMITSWNEWHEDTQIEPVNPSGGVTNQPSLLTRNLAYDAYGSLYLDILKEEYSNASL